MTLRLCSPGCAGILAAWLVLLLLADHGTAFAPAPSLNSDLTRTASPLITKRLQSRRLFLIFQSNRCSGVFRFATTTPTTDGDEAVHAISRAFLAEQEASGRVLTNHDQKWWARFQELEEYKHDHGDCNVPQKYKANPQLGLWAMSQRKFYKNNKLASERIEALEDIGFEWTRPTGGRPDDANWWARFQELEEYKREHGDCNVPQHYKANPKLGKWAMSQRRLYKNNKLASERIEAPEDIGFEWTRPKGGSKPDDPAWWKRFADLKVYKEKHGDCNVPINYKANPQLATWVYSQRACYHRFIDENRKQSPGITKERIEALNKIGFEWRLRERPEWDERYDELVAYKEQHGNTLVPMALRRDSDNKYLGLANWVHTQRRQYQLLQEGKHSQLTDERIQKLDSIGFVWDAQEAAWEEKFNELIEFKATHGHTDVPSPWEDQELFRWVSVQRREYRKLKEGTPSQMTEDRIQRLDGIGFEWRSKKTYQWKIRFGELRDFYDENGAVPVSRAKHPTLYNWVQRQKNEYDKFVRKEKTNMAEERMKDLESIGFFEVYGK